MSFNQELYALSYEVRKGIQIMKPYKKTQTIADNCAIEHGFLCASYRGSVGNAMIYVPLCSNSEVNPKEPTYIIVEDGEAKYLQGIDIDVLAGAHIRDFKKGRKIYKNLYRKLQEKNFECDDDESEEHSIVVSLLIKPRPWINRNVLYDYLEVAERLGLKIELHPNSACTDIDGNWKYHVELRKLCV